MLRLSAQAQILSHRRLLPGRRRPALEEALAGAARGGGRGRAGSRQAKDAVQALLPVGIGAEGGNFNKVYIDTFTRIVRNGENIQTVLNDEGNQLQGIFDKTNAPCWAPDPPSGKSACKVK